VDAAESLAMLLQAYGHRVAMVHTGKAALEVVATEPPDVILLDIGLPQMNGWEIARRIRTEPRGKKPLLIAVTGYSSDGDRQQSLNAGVDLHLVKPVDPAILVGILHRFSRVFATDER